MSKGGFSGKGMFASIPYLVVEYDDGQQKQCNFKYENQVDDLLKLLSAEQPQIRLLSEAAEAKLEKAESRERTGAAFQTGNNHSVTKKKWQSFRGPLITWTRNLS